MKVLCGRCRKVPIFSFVIDVSEKIGGEKDSTYVSRVKVACRGRRVGRVNNPCTI